VPPVRIRIESSLALCAKLICKTDLNSERNSFKFPETFLMRVVTFAPSLLEVPFFKSPEVIVRVGVDISEYGKEYATYRNSE
jgi:hypothetical protein